MRHHLLPERPLLISPSLAATLGLEEAAMLAVLGELLHSHQARSELRGGFRWLRLDADTVTAAMPFWTALDIDRVSASLRDKGVLLLASAPFAECGELKFAVNDSEGDTPGAAAPATPQHHNQPRPGATPMPPNWQPSDDLYRQIAQHNIPQHFIREQIPEFVTYWRERGEHHHAWGSKFLRHLLRQWREQQVAYVQQEQAVPMTLDWRPSPEAWEILERIEIPVDFIEDAIPEFTLYWSERGEKGRTWNSKFIAHVKRQWHRYSAALELDSEPKPIPADWRPSADVDDVLRLANIDLAFAHSLVKEFVIFWRDSAQVHSSWNTKFLQHVKFQWAKRHQLALAGGGHGTQQGQDPTRRTRDRSIWEDLSDRSWAS